MDSSDASCRTEVALYKSQETPSFKLLIGTKMDGANIMYYAIGAFVLLMIIEFLYGKWRHSKLYRLNDTITNLNIGVGSQVFGLLYKVVIIGAMVGIYKEFALTKIPTNVFTIIVIAIMYDFLFYWAHRWGHEINFFWGAHVVHHQSEEYNLSVALRQPWFHSLIAFFIFIPMPLLGFDPYVVLGYSLFSTLYQFWIHTKVIHRMPKWFEFIFNSPSHHRVHHGVNEKYIDKNHGAVFIIWDRIFGTYAEEEEEPTYGITSQFKSFNPVWSNFQYYSDLLATMKPLRLREKIKMVFARPGWTPNGPSPKDQIASVNLKRPKYDTSTPYGLNIYVFAQFLLILWAVVAYMNHFETLSVFYQWFFAGLMLLSMTICGGIFEKKKWVFFAEYARLVMVAISVSVFYYQWYMEWFIPMVIFAGITTVIFYIWFSISLSRNYKTILIG